MVTLLKFNLIFLCAFINHNPVDFDKCGKNKRIISYENFDNKEIIEIPNEYSALKSTFEYIPDSIINPAQYDLSNYEKITGNTKEIVFESIKRLYRDTSDFSRGQNLYYLGDINIMSKIFLLEEKSGDNVFKEIYLISDNGEKITSVVFLTSYTNITNDWGFGHKPIMAKLLKTGYFMLHRRKPADIAITENGLKTMTPRRRNQYLYGSCIKFKINKKGYVRLV